MNARIDLAISAGLAEDPPERSRSDHPEPAESRHEGLFQQLTAMLAPLAAPRPHLCDCPGHASR
ncbi:hypothetical protein [Saccharopolyspora flava]|uniref:Uncharacterized protein n=1 Tax=Saccharopolyspora flava TaxID=95161 RepID=A0A1I6PEG4_9PSEU|nr:hypothetical protein [Saccharopolyspora flava]SFS38571.1 hypothetical protein SAMN05660874_00701 [Saccharopolyspora flava]